ncbi:hypothetical protein HDK77DRAFT_75817 [Phyllosticta capitalensis]|uniref:Uncharacterized protein n=1 Tax=Phyllosticta capitalensis TaxID=121624 RepID=A0ABR1YCB3_9PEZI
MQKRHQRRMPRRRSHVSSVGSFSGHVYAGQAGSMNHEQHYHHDYTCQYKLRAVVSRTRSRSKHSRLSLGQRASQPRSHPPSHHPPAPLHALAASSSTPPCAERAAVRHPSSHTHIPPSSSFHIPRSFPPFPRPAGRSPPTNPPSPIHLHSLGIYSRPTLSLLPPRSNDAPHRRRTGTDVPSAPPTRARVRLLSPSGSFRRHVLLDLPCSFLSPLPYSVCACLPACLPQPNPPCPLSGVVAWAWLGPIDTPISWLAGRPAGC